MLGPEIPSSEGSEPVPAPYTCVSYWPKTCRRLSVLVHPDKNPGDEAREAFEALNEAHRQLRDRGGLVSMFIPIHIHLSAFRVSEYAT